MPVFKKTPFLPTLAETPLPPTVTLTPLLEKFSLMPLKMLMLLRKRMRLASDLLNDGIILHDIGD